MATNLLLALKEEKTTLEKQLEGNPTYKRLRMVLSLIKDSSTTPVKPNKIKRSIKLPKVISTPSQDPISNDADNLIGALSFNWGQKCEYVYEATQEILKSMGGIASIEEVEKALHNDYKFTCMSVSKRSKERLTSVLLTQHRLHPNSKKIDMFPKRKEGDARVGKYRTLKLIA